MQKEQHAGDTTRGGPSRSRRAHRSMRVCSPSSPDTRSTSSSCTRGRNSAEHSSSVSPVPSSGGVSSTFCSFSAALDDVLETAVTPLNPPNPVPAPKVEADPKTGEGDDACTGRSWPSGQ